jgi:hypothetical protein
MLMWQQGKGFGRRAQGYLRIDANRAKESPSQIEISYVGYKCLWL